MEDSVMDVLAGVGCLISISIFWVLPIVLGVKAARKNNRSPHWMWFGVHPFGAWSAEYRSWLLGSGLDWYPASVGMQFLLEEREKQLARIKDAEKQIQQIDQTIERLQKAG